MIFHNYLHLLPQGYFICSLTTGFVTVQLFSTVVLPLVFFLSLKETPPKIKNKTFWRLKRLIQLLLLGNTLISGH